MSRSTLPLFTLVALTMQLAVPTALASSTCRASILDTVAGLGTELSVTSCESERQAVLQIEGPAPSTYTQAIVLDAAGNATTLIPSKVTTAAGRHVFTVAGERGSFTVLADRADDAHSRITVRPMTIGSNGTDVATVTVILRDQYDNPVSGRPLALIASRLTDEISAQSKETDESGRFLWTVRATQNGTASLTVYDVAGGRQMKLKADLRIGAGSSTLRSQLTGFEQGGIGRAYAADTVADATDFSSANAVIDHFELSLPQNAIDVKVNELFSITVRAMRGSQIVRGYIGTLIVTSSDPDADLPKKSEDQRNPDAGRIDVRGMDQGERRVPLAFVFRSGGAQTLTVTDKQNSSIAGSLTINVLQGESSDRNKIVIFDPADRSTVRSGPILLQGHAPSLINLKVKGGSQIVTGETDSEGVWRISVPLHPQDREVTLFVQSENGTYESDPVHILIDEGAPTIESITFDPAETIADEPAMIIVKSESGLATVTAAVGTDSVTLTEDSEEMGLYRGTITAPNRDGIYDVTVTSKDDAGNTLSMLTKWTVKPKSLPVVQGVTAESQPGSVLLQWQPVTSFPISEYKIYIALDHDPQNYVYSIGTQKPLTSAVIKDLPLGQAYRFSLTALTTDGTESAEKSVAVLASPLGMVVKVTPGTDSLMLEWSAVPDLPLDHYRLEYGTTPGEYPEKRTINGQANSAVLHDLISGVIYELKLTPVTVTGKALTEFATIVHGTPGGSGFTPGAAELVPTDILGGHPGAPLTPSPHITNVPSNTDSGFPSVTMSVLAVLAFVFGLHWRRARRDRCLANEFLKMMQQRYQRIRN